MSSTMHLRQSMNRHPFTTSKEVGADWTKARRTHYSPFRGEALDDDSANHIEQGREIGGRDCPTMRTANPAGIQAARSVVGRAVSARHRRDLVAQEIVRLRNSAEPGPQLHQ